MNDLDMNDNFDSGFERYRTYSLYFHRAFNGLILQFIFTVIDEFFYLHVFHCFGCWAWQCLLHSHFMHQK